jgi:hypothetical protein
MFLSSLVFGEYKRERKHTDEERRKGAFLLDKFWTGVPALWDEFFWFLVDCLAC